MRESVMVEPWCKPTIGHVPIGTALHHTKGARFIIGIPPGPSIAPLPPPCISFLPCLLWAFPATCLAEASISLPFVALCHVCVSLLFNASHPFSLALARLYFAKVYLFNFGWVIFLSFWPHILAKQIHIDVLELWRQIAGTDCGISFSGFVVCCLKTRWLIYARSLVFYMFWLSIGAYNREEG